CRAGRHCAVPDPAGAAAEGAAGTGGRQAPVLKVLPAELPNATSDANQVAASGAQAVLLGSVDVPTVAAFMKASQQQHYNPKILAATAGPDQGAPFLKAVGKANATAAMTATGWYGRGGTPH